MSQEIINTFYVSIFYPFLFLILFVKFMTRASVSACQIFFTHILQPLRLLNHIILVFLI